MLIIVTTFKKKKEAETICSNLTILNNLKF